MSARWFDRALLAGAVIVWAIALPVPPMDVDAAQYATMARELLERGDWLHVTNRGQPYLDKPPLVFWTGAISYALFGVGIVQSKLPSFLFALLAIFSTERLAARLFDATTGRIAAVLLATTQALFLITNDCRTDTLLMGAVAFACWQLVAFERDRQWRNVFGAALGLSLALHAKGPIGAAIPVLALVVDIAARRAWRSVLDPRWIVLAALVAVSLVPMLIGLHDQYGADGPLFFLWTQSFGRITGSNKWRDTTTPLFFTHTFLWSFLPWSLLAIAAAWERFVQLVKRAPAAREAAFPLGGFVLGFIGLSASQYKLPHYLFVIFPLAAVLTAKWIRDRIELPAALGWRIVQGVVTAALVVLVVGLCTWAFPGASVLVWIVGIGLFGAAFWLLVARRDWSGVVASGAVAMLAANVFLGGHFYPALLEYQAPTQAARLLRERNIPAERVHSLNVEAYSLDFGVGGVVRPWPGVEAGEAYVFTDRPGIEAIRRMNVRNETVQVFQDFHVTMLKGTFLNPATRAETLEPRFLVRIIPRR